LDVWLAVIGLIAGLVILLLSSDKTIDQLIQLATMFGVSAFTAGFVVSAIGSDLPEIVNSLVSAYLGHGDIAVGNSFGSVAAQIALVLGLIPFFCTFCRLIPRKFMAVGLVEVAVLAVAIFLATDGAITRLDSIVLLVLWAISIYILRRAEGDRVAVEPSEAIEVTEKPNRLVLWTVVGFIGIGVGSYLIVESVITISTTLGVSEYLLSFFLLAIGTSLPELAVGVAAIKRRQYELALGDIIGSCVVDATIAVGFGPLFFPIAVSGTEVLLTGLYTLFLSVVVVLTLSLRGYNDKRSGALFILLYGISYLMPYIL
jgi:cation:H+ antiporter